MRVYYKSPTLCRNIMQIDLYANKANTKNDILCTRSETVQAFVTSQVTSIFLVMHFHMSLKLENIIIFLISLILIKKCLYIWSYSSSDGYNGDSKHMKMILIAACICNIWLLSRFYLKRRKK